MSWNILLHPKVQKSFNELPPKVKREIRLLIYELKFAGPVRGNWKNFAKLNKNRYHCHIKSGKPTYVVIWEVIDKKEKIVEVSYAGTHEKAPY